MKFKTLLIILDGLGDLPSQKLGMKTPLEKAYTPNMDYLASIGMNGIMDPIAPGIAPGSDVAHLAIFGYDPHREYPGRGPFEAEGYGIELTGHEIALRANFATVTQKDGKLIVTDRRAGRITKPLTSELAKAVNEALEREGLNVEFIPTVEHRGVLIIKGGGLSPEITDTDPHVTGAPVLLSRPLAHAKNPDAASKTAQILNKFTLISYKVLKEHPINKKLAEGGKPQANVILARGAGSKAHIETFEARWNLKAACIAAGPLYRGIGRVLGMTMIDVPGATALPKSNFKGKIKSAINALDEHDFVYVHIKGTDVSSHKKNPVEKAEVLEKVDEAMEELKEVARESYVVVTGDHSTPCKLGVHSGDPVPILIAGPLVRVDKVKRFSELDALHGSLGRIRGRDLMNILIGLMERNVEYGARLEPMEVRVMPKSWVPLRVS